MTKNIAVFASGTGSNFVEIYKACQNQEINAFISFFFSDKKNSLSLKRAKEFNLNYLSLSLKDFDNKEAFEEEICKELDKYDIDLIILAGYMKIIGKTLLSRYKHKIINIHPSILPAYRGKDAIIRQHNEQYQNLGITIHYVDDGIDTGEIIFQKQIKVEYPIALEKLEEKIHEIEHRYYKEVIEMILEGNNEKSAN